LRRCEAEGLVSSSDATVVVLLRIHYTPDYPDAIPDISLDVVEEGAEEDQLTEEDQTKLIDGLKAAVGACLPC